MGFEPLSPAPPAAHVGGAKECLIRDCLVPQTPSCVTLADPG